MLALAVIVAGVLASAGLGLLATAAQAQVCPNEALREQQPYGKRLPDCRAYEQVTPTEKNGANPIGDTAFVQSAADGQRVTYLVPAGAPGAPGEGNFPLFLSSRDPSGWTSEGLLPPSAPGASLNVLGWSEDLALFAVENVNENARGSEGLELRESADSSFMLAVPGGYGYHLAGFSADHSRVLFESTAPLLPDAAPEEVDTLYEWDATKPAGERLSLAGVLPDGTTPPGGSFAGAYEWTLQGETKGGAQEGMYTQNTISADGSKIIFTTGGERPAADQLYVRENGTATVQASASQRTEPDPNGTKPAAFMAATPDGSKIFFTSCQKLTNDSTAVSTAAPECTTREQGQDLYEYDTASGRLADLTNEAVVDLSTSPETHGAAVQGVLGISEDGAYVYFAANGVLTPGATPGHCLGTESEYGKVEACNLYVWHEGEIKFVARQNPVTSSFAFLRGLLSHVQISSGAASLCG